jgi:hypothetical protein
MNGKSEWIEGGRAGQHATSGDWEVPSRCRALVRRRYFVDREPGALLMGLPADEATRQDVASLVPRAQAWHPRVTFAIQRAGAALAVKASARESELDQIYALYFTEPAAEPPAAEPPAAEPPAS